ncbi:MAG: hypothetical protein KIT68_09940 [Phycisphaeraceae bacterium]|nr:hypothetical protein [Phycisphaeraceae bacterium]
MKDLSAQIEPARALIRAGNLPGARDALMLLARREPSHPQVNALLARTQYELGDLNKAEHYARRALTALRGDPVTVQDLNDAADLAAIAGDAQRAIGWARRLIELEPAKVKHRVRLVNLLMSQRRHLEAMDAARAGLAEAPGDAPLTGLLAGLLQRTARVDEALPLLGEVTRTVPQEPGGWNILATAMNYTDVDPLESLAVHRTLGRLLESAVAPLSTRRNGARLPLRVGLISPDLRAHSVARFIEPVLEHADATAVRYRCYFTDPYPDAVSARLAKRAAVWRHLPKTAPQKIAEVIRNDDNDLLVDLCGLFDGNNLPVLALKPAPVQATYLGYPNTTGLTRVDWRIVDSITDPPGEADALATERLARLEGCFVCFRPDAEPPPMPDPQREHVVFGSFNAAQKISERTARLWARVLAACPGARLAIKSGDPIGPGIDAVIRERFGRAGVSPERLEVLPWADYGAYGNDFAQLDVALDPTPYNGTTTTCETLCAGVPVVTLRGRVHAARVGASLLMAVGRPEWIADDEDGYVARCVALAAAGPRSAADRRALRAQVLASPLTDGPAFARRFERLLLRLARGE